MSTYNPITILRMTRRDLLSQFFKEMNCDLGIDVMKAKFYDLRDAFNCLPVLNLSRAERVMRDVFFFGTDDATLSKVIEAVKVLGYTFPPEFDNFRKRYDKALYIYLNYRMVWDSTSLFAHSDKLASQNWYRLRVPAALHIKHDVESMKYFETVVSEYFQKNQQRGKNCVGEYMKRYNGLEYIFLYLSNYSDLYEKWENDNGDQKLVRRAECHAFNVVFIYNSEQGVVDTFCMGGRKHAENLQKIFCDSLFEEKIETKEILKNNYIIDQLKYEGNKLKPCPQLGIFNPRIVMMSFTIPDEKRRGMSFHLGDDADNGEIYRTINETANFKNYSLEVLRLTKIRIIIDVIRNGETHSIVMDIQRNSCTLIGLTEEDRLIGDQYLLEEKINVQPTLF